METITLTGRDVRRLRTIEAALAGRVTNSEEARQLGLSTGQFIRLRQRGALGGIGGVIHTCSRQSICSLRIETGHAAKCRRRAPKRRTLVLYGQRSTD